MDLTSIKIDKETRARLRLLLAQKRMTSYDQLLIYLLKKEKGSKFPVKSNSQINKTKGKK